MHNKTTHFERNASHGLRAQIDEIFTTLRPKHNLVVLERETTLKSSATHNAPAYRRHLVSRAEATIQGQKTRQPLV